MIIKNDQDTIKSYFEDSSNLKGGYAKSVAIPEDIASLSGAVSEANKSNTPVTISGGGTGTTGARIPFGGIVISLERLNRIIDISTENMRGIAQAGVLVEEFKEACERKRLFYACHPTEKTACLGGTVATNASGARSFKYGPTRRYVRRLKMVLSDGEIFEIRRGEQILTKESPYIRLASGSRISIPIPDYKIPSVKNSAGYYAADGTDAIDLFIGQEGTLSIIAEIEMDLPKMPYKIFSSFVFFPNEEDSWAFAADARKKPALSIEYFDRNALDLLRKKNVNIPAGAHTAIFFEQEMTRLDEQSIADSWLNTISAHNASPDDTWVAMTEEMCEKFNQFRHSIPESINEIVKKNGFRKLSTDIAVPEYNFTSMMKFYTDTLKAGNVEHVMFGHIGECHVHVNLLPRTESELKKSEDICLAFVRKAVALGGTISAEHGIGKTRRRYLKEMYGEKGLLQMAAIKKAIDPNCILGQDNIFAKELLQSV